jgi:hypothetical protein
MIVEMAERLGVTPRAKASSPDVWVRLHTCADEVLAFAVNLSPEDREVEITFGEGIEMNEATDVVTGAPVEAKMTIRGRDARLIRGRSICSEGR